MRAWTAITILNRSLWVCYCSFSPNSKCTAMFDFYLFALSANNSWAHGITQESDCVFAVKVSCRMATQAFSRSTHKSKAHRPSSPVNVFLMFVYIQLTKKPHWIRPGGGVGGVEKEMSSCGRFVENKEIKTGKKRKTEKICNKASLLQSDPNTENESVRNPRTTTSLFSPPTCASELGTHCKIWILTYTARNIFTTILKKTESIVSCRAEGKDPSWWEDAEEEESLSSDILRWMINRCFVCVSKGLGLSVLDGLGVRHWLRQRLASLFASQSPCLAQSTKQLRSDSEVKSTVHEQRQSQGGDEG